VLGGLRRAVHYGLAYHNKTMPNGWPSAPAGLAGHLLRPAFLGLAMDGGWRGDDGDRSTSGRVWA
jgi:hypothetical protein